MSYLVLARKSRPQTFAQVVGQRSIVRTLQNSLARNRVAHAILFSGVRGVGKTTLARLMAKAINCQTEDKIRPCDECDSCNEIKTGASLDLYEIDGASNRGIQEIRELKEKLRFLPTTSKYKIFIIDEVHMLTTEAFNALLKTLEEPPGHVYFMFATTELHKIPITILSRCQQYELKRIPAAELYDHFKSLVTAEGFDIEPAALSLIVRESEGSVRDGLSLLDQMFSFGEKTIGSRDVIEALGLVDRDVLIQLARGLLEGKQGEVFLALEEIFKFGVDIKRFLIDLMGYFRTLLLLKIKGCASLIDLPADELTIFQKLAANYSYETLHQKLSLLMSATEDIRYSSQPRLTLETSFLKIIEANNVVKVSSLLGKLDKVLQALPSQPVTPPAESIDLKNEDRVKKKVEPAPPEPIATQAPPKPDQSRKDDSGPVKGIPPIGESKPSDSTGMPNKPNPGLKKDIRKDWLDFIAYVKDRKEWMAQDLQRADSIKQENGELHLTYLDPANSAVLRQKNNHELLTEFTLDFFQKVIVIRFILPEDNSSSEDQSTESPQRKRQELAADPLVVMATEIFNGRVGDIRVGPRSR